MTFLSIPSRFVSALSLLAIMAASGPGLSRAEVISSDFTTRVEVKGRETPFTTRQLELIASEIETIFNAMSDDARLSFVTVSQKQEEVEEASDNNDERQLGRRNRYWLYTGGKYRCNACKPRPPRADRRLGGQENADSSSTIERLLPGGSDIFLQHLDTELKELLDGITAISWA
jgi:hypothetical protein